MNALQRGDAWLRIAPVDPPKLERVVDEMKVRYGFEIRKPKPGKLKAEVDLILGTCTIRPGSATGAFIPRPSTRPTNFMKI